jgi:hypothetical protein
MSKRPIVRVDAARISDWNSFHEEFALAFSFPGFYGRNMDAFIDCLSYLDEPSEGMTTVHAPPGGVVTLVVDGMADFAQRCPEVYAAIIESMAFVNWRRIERGSDAVIAIAFS